jgi:hypothetical protein
MKTIITATLAAAFAIALGWLGPTALDTPSLQDAKSAATTEQRFDRAARMACGGENSAYKLTDQPGEIRCFTKRGKATITAKVTP